MYTREELEEELKCEEAREYIATSLNPEIAPRLSKALEAAFELLTAKNDWVACNIVATRMVAAGSVQMSTARGLVSKLVRARHIERRGELKLSKVNGGDFREIRIIDWPRKH